MPYTNLSDNPILVWCEATPRPVIRPHPIDGRTHRSAPTHPTPDHRLRSAVNFAFSILHFSFFNFLEILNVFV